MDVEHDARQQKFYSIHKDTEYSLEYNVVGPGVWEFHCPYTPDSRKDMEIKDFLIEYALYFIRRNKIQLQNEGNCEYFNNFSHRRKDIYDFLVR